MDTQPTEPTGNPRTPMQEIGFSGLGVMALGLLVSLVWTPVGLLFLWGGLTVFCFGNYASSRLGFDDHWIGPYIAGIGTFWAFSLFIVAAVAIITNTPG